MTGGGTEGFCSTAQQMTPVAVRTGEVAETARRESGERHCCSKEAEPHQGDETAH